MNIAEKNRAERMVESWVADAKVAIQATANINIDAVEDEIGCGNGLLTFKVGTPEAGIIVHFKYADGSFGDFADNPGWGAFIHPWDEDVPCPWDISVTVDRHTAIVRIECPKETLITWPGKVSTCDHCGQEVTA